VKAQLRQAALRLQSAVHGVAFTGAGISSPSGIPDFRGPTSGLWNFVDPLAVASMWSFEEDPEAFYRWIRPFAHKFWSARPNVAHRALARLEEQGLVRAVITQNVDGLHQRAGSRRVLELHGDLQALFCVHCRCLHPSEAYWRHFLADGQLPRCPSCCAVLKPGAVLFGEELAHEVVRAAQQEALSCDLMIVAGSSLEVMPAADVPRLAHRQGACLIIINDQPTPLDQVAEYTFHADVTQVLPGLAELCGREAGQDLRARRPVLLHD
jgi:NAD-dependent deacetylase